MSIYGPPKHRHRPRPRVALGVLVAFALALVWGLLVGGARSATVTPGLIAFTRQDGIYAIRTDGSPAVPVRRGGWAKYPQALAWSPDGSKLAFTAQGIWAMNADGTHLTRLAGAVWESYSLTWSPDGRKIAFTSSRGGDSDIWVMNANGTSKHRLLRTPDLSEHQVDWSPDGRRIAFDAQVNPYNPWGPSDIYVVKTDGRNLRNLTAPRGRGWAGSPDWSPDGRRIVFLGSSPSEHGIYAMNANGRARVRLTGDGLSPVWSPDGSEIAFVRGTVARPGSSDLYVMKANGTGMKALTHSRASEASPEWQPSGTP